MPDARRPALRYRDLAPGDLDSLHAIVSDWQVTRQLGSWPWPPDRAFTKSRSVPFEGDGFVWAILEDGHLIGTVGVAERSLGYMLARSHWGRGRGGEAVAAALDRAFSESPADVTATVWHDNLASRRLLERMGFEMTEGGTARSIARGGDVAKQDYRLSREVWERLSGAGVWRRRGF